MPSTVRPAPPTTAEELERLTQENAALTLRLADLEQRLADTVELLHIWKSQASAYRLKFELLQRSSADRPRD